MSNKSWWRDFAIKLGKLREAGDRKGVRKLEFGGYVRDRRNAVSGLTQTKAAELSGISLSEWGKIEAGKHLPQPLKIADIADAIRVPVNSLYRKAGLEAPPKYAHYDIRQAVKDFTYALKECFSFEEFIVRMQWVWEEYKQDQTKPGKRKSIYIDLNQAELLEHIHEVLNVPQKIKLARALLQGIDQKTIRATLRDAPDLFRALDTRST